MRNMNTNYFGQNNPDIRDIVDNAACRVYIQKTLADVLSNLNVAQSHHTSEVIVELARQYVHLVDYERKAHEALPNAEGRLTALSDRSSIIYGQISPFVNGKVLDLGCGDGNVGKQIATKKGLEVALADVYLNPNVAQTGLPHVEFAQNGRVPFQDNEFDTALLLTVLHHADDPIAVLKEARRLTKPQGKIVVIESVYGISDHSSFGQLATEQQRFVNIFFDHFYNRAIHFSEDEAHKVNIPFNFNTPEGWKAIFEKEGLEQITLEHLGIDQPAVPEYHTLHVLKVNK